MARMNMPSLILPPGFRFHPTDEELINHYLKKKASSSSDDPELSIIANINIYKFNPWELPGKPSIFSSLMYDHTTISCLFVQERPCLEKMSGFSSVQEIENIQMVVAQIEQLHLVTGKPQELINQYSHPMDHNVLG